MDEYLSAPRGLHGTQDHDNMAPTSPGSASIAESTPDPRDTDALSQISADLAAISATMLTRKDKAEMVAELRRQVEDLDNRGRRNNIRVRGIPETEGENPHEILTSLFSQLLRDEAPPDFGIERAHRTLRTPRRDGLHRDVICCLLSFQLKESIMRAARAQHDVPFMDTRFSLYQNLSTLTLDARWALKPITRLLQEKRILYKWGYPFSLQAKVENHWHIIRWPNDIPHFLWATGLPHVTVPNWIFEGPPARATGPNEPSRNLHGSQDPRAQRIRGGPVGPEE
ncbi:Hypothetical predicted protein [Pelobates cultripes]|uniref:Uncharacterized protein n=1 Tax=Pelobates cultripes TaxID=61616 RepID=A0AAD1RSA1_PELCU|nr:Hypothetical predicted protein [Pelobates cultripes]